MSVSASEHVIIHPRKHNYLAFLITFLSILIIALASIVVYETLIIFRDQEKFSKERDRSNKRINELVDLNSDWQDKVEAHKRHVRELTVTAEQKDYLEKRNEILKTEIEHLKKQNMHLDSNLTMCKENLDFANEFDNFAKMPMEEIACDLTDIIKIVTNTIEKAYKNF